MAQIIQDGYVNYFEVLGLDESAKQGEVRKNYKAMMKDLVWEIGRVEITEEKRDRYLLDMAKLNAAFYILRDNESRDAYWNLRNEVMETEAAWREADETKSPELDALRRTYDSRLRDFLSRYVEEAMLEAGRDKECVEASNWDAAHERHASRILRHYRHSAYQQILERLPYWDVTRPIIDWEERARTAAKLLAGKAF